MNDDPAANQLASRIWILGVAEHIVSFLPRNDILCVVRSLNKELAEHVKVTYPDLTVTVRQPSWHPAFAAQWRTPGALWRLSHRQRRQLMLFTAGTGSLPNLKVAVEVTGGPMEAELFETAAGLGHLEMCHWLFQGGCPFGDALSAAARAGHKHVCGWLLGAGCGWHLKSLFAAARAGHRELVDWLVLQRPHDDSTLGIASRLALAAECFGLVELQQQYAELLGKPEVAPPPPYKGQLPGHQQQRLQQTQHLQHPHPRPPWQLPGRRPSQSEPQLHWQSAPQRQVELQPRCQRAPPIQQQQQQRPQQLPRQAQPLSQQPHPMLRQLQRPLQPPHPWARRPQQTPRPVHHTAALLQTPPRRLHAQQLPQPLQHPKTQRQPLQPRQPPQEQAQQPNSQRQTTGVIKPQPRQPQQQPEPQHRSQSKPQWQSVYARQQQQPVRQPSLRPQPQPLSQPQRQPLVQTQPTQQLQRPLLSRQHRALQQQAQAKPASGSHAQLQMQSLPRRQEEHLDPAAQAMILSSAACSLTPDWQDKVMWLEARGCKQTALACDRAAALPDAASRLGWLLSRSYPVQSGASRAAVRMGNAPALEYLMEKAPALDFALGPEAAAGGHLEVLKLLHGRHKLDKYAMVTGSAAHQGHRAVVDWMKEQRLGFAVQEIMGGVIVMDANVPLEAFPAIGNVLGLLMQFLQDLLDDGEGQLEPQQAQVAPLQQQQAVQQQQEQMPPLQQQAAEQQQMPPPQQVEVEDGEDDDDGEGEDNDESNGDSEEESDGDNDEESNGDDEEVRNLPQYWQDLLRQSEAKVRTVGNWAGAAAMLGDLAMLKDELERGAPLSASVFRAATHGGSEEALEWLVQRGCPMPGDGSPYIIAADEGDLVTLRCLRRLGCAFHATGSILRQALRVPLPALRVLLEEVSDPPADRKEVDAAARQLNLSEEVLAWLTARQHGPEDQRPEA